MRLVRPLALLLLVTGVAVAAPVPVMPAAQPFRIGAVRAWGLRDMLNVVPNDGKVFGTDVGAATVADALRGDGVPPDRVTLGVDALLLRMPGRVVLLDTGLGPKVGGVLMRSLAEAGVQPAEVTDVLITHSHGDHVGGLVDAAGAPAFPNAAIRMSAAEWSWLRGKPGQAALVAAIAAKVQPFAPGAEVVPGITALALPGHTPGHVGYEIRSGAARLLDIGDSAHSSLLSLGHPDWLIGYDTDAQEGRTQREAVLAKLAASHERVFAPHFPYPGVGTVERQGSGYRWVPAKL